MEAAWNSISKVIVVCVALLFPNIRDNAVVGCILVCFHKQINILCHLFLVSSSTVALALFFARKPIIRTQIEFSNANS